MQIIRWFANKLRQRNGIYLALALIARVLNAFGMFLAIRRFSPNAFGELGYLQATAVSAVAFTSFGIDLSINAQLSRKRKQTSDLRPTLAAGCALAASGIVLVCIAIVSFYSSQLHVTGQLGLTEVALCIFCSLTILTSLLNAISFALEANINVGIAHLTNASIFVAAAIFAPVSETGTDLLLFLAFAQFISATFLLTCILMRLAKQPQPESRGVDVFIAEALAEIRTLFVYGTKQIIIVSVLAFSYWLIQRKIVFGAGGTADNAIYSVGNQVFNVMNFIPGLLAPVIVSRLAGADANVELRRRICIRSVKLFVGIAVIACICAFFGLRVAVLFLPGRYAAAVTTGTLAAIAAAFSILRTPFTLYFLSELRASREIAGSLAGAIFMIAAASLYDQLQPNTGTVIRLLGCALQAALMAAFFVTESRARPISVAP
jgi:O-antigen/teichoic acid export membrane protein